MMTLEPPARYSPEWWAMFQMLHPEQAAAFSARYDEAITCYVAGTFRHNEWELIALWRIYAQKGHVGGPDDGARGTGGADRQEV